MWLVVLSGCGFGGAAGDGPSDDSSTDTTDDSSTDADAPGDEVTDDMSTDAPDGPQAPDAPTFDLSTCPQGYMSIAGAPSRYRFGTTNSNAYDAFRVCADDLEQATHPVVFETKAELDALQADVRSNRNGKYWTGAIQPLGEDSPGAGWIWITGGTVPDGWWRTPLEPSDYNIDEGDVDGDEHDYEQFMRIDHFAESGLVDVPGGVDGFLLCECDGKRLDSAAESVLDSITP